MRSWAAAGLFFAAAGLALAQVGEISLSGGVSRFGGAKLGSVLDELGNPSDIDIKDGFRLAVRFTVNTYRFAGHEFGYAYNRSSIDFGTGAKYPTTVHQGFYDFLLYATPEG